MKARTWFPVWTAVAVPGVCRVAAIWFEMPDSAWFVPTGATMMVDLGIPARLVGLAVVANVVDFGVVVKMVDFGAEAMRLAFDVLVKMVDF